MTQALATLKTHLNAIMPLLADNLSAAHSEHMVGKIAHGAYNVCLGRQATVLSVLAASEEKVTVPQALSACSLIFIDLRTAIDDVPAEARPAAQAKVDALLEFYREQGFTETNTFFDVPMMPAPAAAMH